MLEPENSTNEKPEETSVSLDEVKPDPEDKSSDHIEAEIAKTDEIEPENVEIKPLTNVDESQPEKHPDPDTDTQISESTNIDMKPDNDEKTEQQIAEASDSSSRIDDQLKPDKDESESDTDAVQAVVAAVELAQKSAASESPAKPASTTVKRKPAKTNSNLNESKRRKKDPSAPKAPLNGYLVYFNEERAGMRAQNPNIGFGELTKIIAAKWKELPTEAKQRYINEADQDKERYEKEMASYKKSDAYKQYLKDDSLNKLARQESSGENMLNNGINHDESPNLTWLQNETNIAGFDVPIFTEEFIEHSKSREQEIRQLRKDVAELERQNDLIQKNIENIRKSMGNVDMDYNGLHAQNDQIQKNLNIMRQTLLNCFKNGNPQERIELDNLDEYVFKMNSFLKQQGSFDDASANYFMHVKSIISKINFNPLFS